MAEQVRPSIYEDTTNLRPESAADERFRALRNRFRYLTTMFTTGEPNFRPQERSQAFDWHLYVDNKPTFLRMYVNTFGYAFKEPGASFVINERSRVHIPAGKPFQPTERSSDLDDEMLKIWEVLDTIAQLENQVGRGIEPAHREVFEGRGEFFYPHFVVDDHLSREGIALYSNSGITIPLHEIGFGSAKETNIVVGLFFKPVTYVEHARTKDSIRSHGQVYPLIV